MGQTLYKTSHFKDMFHKTLSKYLAKVDPVLKILNEILYAFMVVRAALMIDFSCFIGFIKTGGQKVIKCKACQEKSNKM